MKKTPRILTIGEILWDMLPEGPQLGGAPANFTFYCHELGANTQLISAVGNDQLGEEIIDKFAKISSLISVNGWPTSQVGIELKDGIPKYHIKENVAWDHLSLTSKAQELLTDCNAMCFGTLAQRNPESRSTIQQLLEKVPKNCLKVFDINLRQEYYTKELIHDSLIQTDLLKINEDELQKLSALFSLKGDETERLKQLLNTYSLKWVALTKGSEGSCLVSETEADHQPIIKTNVLDTIGAGDSFLAGLVTELLSGSTLKEAHIKACDISSFVCGQKGAMAHLPK